MRPLVAALLAIAALAPECPVAAPPQPVLDLNDIARNWTAFGRLGDWTVYYSPTETDRSALAETGQGPPLAIAITGWPLPALGAYVECRPWMCGTSLHFGILVGHDVYRSPARPGDQASEHRTRILLEPDAGFSCESDAHLAVAKEGYPLRLSMLLSILLPDGHPSHRLMKGSSSLLPAQSLGEIRRSSVLRAHVRHADGTSRVHAISLWGFSSALDVMELKCRYEAETVAVETKKACRGFLEMDGRR